MTYEVVRDVAAFAGVITGAVIAFATWESLRAHRKPLELYALHTATGESVYLVPFSVANRTPSDRQVDDAWLDLAPPASPPRGPWRLPKTLITRLRRILRRKQPDIRVFAVRHAIRQAGRNWVRLGGVEIQNPLYVPFKIPGFGREEGTLFFAILPWDEELLGQHGSPASREFLDMMGVKVDRAFIGRLTIKDDRGKTRSAPVFVLPTPQPVG